MNIKFEDYDLSEFIVKDVIFCGIDAVLINPNHIGTKFTQKNKIFRSSIWSKNTGELLSGMFKKFVNFSENPENFPVPTSLDGCRIVDKIDGSLVGIDYINDCISMRTRGTSSYMSLDNYKDFEYCLSKYPLIKDWITTHSNYTLLLEITTPNLKIVIDYGNEPDFWLIGAIDKNDYSLMTQDKLDGLSKEIGVKRPEYYTFSSMDTLMQSIKAIQGKEGCCLYSNGDSEIHKIKGEKYLMLHRMKSELSSIEKVIDLWISLNYPDYNTFYNEVVNSFDYEIAEIARGHMSNICDAWKEVKQIEAGMRKFVESINHLSTRKDKALRVIQSYGGESNNRAGMVFTLLDNKPFTGEMYKKLIFQVLK